MEAEPLPAAKRLFNNPRYAYVGMGVLAALFCFSLLFARSPVFPEDLPSAENLSIRGENHHTQKDFALRFASFMRTSHGGLLVAKQIDRVASVGGLEGHGYVTFLQKFTRIKEARLLDLAQKFATQEGLVVKVNKLSAKNQKNAQPKYQLDFAKDQDLWVRVEARTGAKAKLPAQPKQAEPVAVEVAVSQTNTPQSEHTPMLAPQGRLVIIIDDMGGDIKRFKRFAGLDDRLTFSVLPGLRHSKATAELAHKMGREVMLDIPMQPRSYPRINPGPGALLTTDSPEETLAKIQDSLAQVPHAIGASNHMGSAFIASEQGMGQVMKSLSDAGLFFLDSRTAPSGTALGQANRFAVPFFSRNLFLDEKPGVEAARAQLDKALAIAKKNGIAVAIGRAQNTTFEMLTEALPELEAQGIQLVRASALLKS